MCIVYHNSKCSKSRATLDILKQNNLKFNIIDYLKNPPSKVQLQQILQQLNISAKEFIRSEEPQFEALNLKNKTNDELLDAMVKNPILIQRPIVITKKGSAIGRPPENILKII